VTKPRVKVVGGEGKHKKKTTQPRVNIPGAITPKHASTKRWGKILGGGDGKKKREMPKKRVACGRSQKKRPGASAKAGEKRGGEHQETSDQECKKATQKGEVEGGHERGGKKGERFVTRFTTPRTQGNQHSRAPEGEQDS